MQTEEFIEIEPNVSLHVRDWGQGRTIVFIPGWPLSHEMYEYQFTQLPQHGYRCVGITPRGFGKSSKPWGEYTYDIFADDIRVVLEKLDLQDVTLAGHSMGGAVALHYMSRHKGERVSRLALFGAAAPSFTKRPGFQFGIGPEEVDKLISSCHEDRAKLNINFGKIFFNGENAVSPELGAWFQNMCMEASPHATAACLAALRDSDLREDMTRVTVPAAIFHSIQDKICPFQLAESLAAGISGAKLIRFEKSGHGLFYEEKDKFNKEIMNFVG
jgi:pimeloyl-ACP methyl ester carboxylesterase